MVLRVRNVVGWSRPRTVVMIIFSPVVSNIQHFCTYPFLYLLYIIRRLVYSFAFSFFAGPDPEPDGVAEAAGGPGPDSGVHESSARWTGLLRCHLVLPLINILDYPYALVNFNHHLLLFIRALLDSEAWSRPGLSFPLACYPVPVVQDIG